MATATPVLWMLVTAWRSPAEIYAAGLEPWPAHPTVGNYFLVLREVPIIRLLLNSVIVSTSVAAGQVVSSILAAYAFIRFNFWGRDVFFYAIVATMLVPFHVTLIPLYLLVSTLHWLNTYEGLIVPQIASGFGIFLLRQHFKAFPTSLLECAELDGATSWQALWRVLVPGNATAVWSLGVLLFINAWNEYLWPLLVATDRQMQTLPVGIAAFVNLEGGTEWGALMAAASLAVVPALAIYLIAQRHILESVVTTGIRG